MNNLKFSIIIPSYNQGEFIEQTILSLIDQNYSKIEIIVIDGGSTDNTKSILEKYNDYIAYWQSKPDDGQADAIAIGFDLATGDILSWLNSDDIYTHSTIYKVNDIFSNLNSNVEIVYGNMYIINEIGKVVGKRYLTKFLPNCIRDSYLCGGFGIYQPATFWRRNLYERSGGVDKSLKFCMDNDLFNRFVIHGGKFHYLNSFLASFRIHSNSKTSNQQNIADYERAILYKKYVQDSKIKLPKFKKLLARTYRILMLIIYGRFFTVIKMRYFDKSNWVP